MFAPLIAAALAAQAAPVEVGFEELSTGRNTAAIARMEQQPAAADDPARLLNLGIAYARGGDGAKARAMFTAVLRSAERMELETATGTWVDSRVLARRALAMLDAGAFGRSGQFASK
jgi:hypothetical protein